MFLSSLLGRNLGEDLDVGISSSLVGLADPREYLRRRISELPGFGEMKIKAFGAVLAKRFGVDAARELAPSHPTLGDVDSSEALERYQAMKREYKARLKAQQA